MLPDRVSNPGPLTYESGALPIALRGPAKSKVQNKFGNMKYPLTAIFIFINKRKMSGRPLLFKALLLVKDLLTL